MLYFSFAPNGRYWRYDKNYPWCWEYAYTIPVDKRPQIVIAHTDIGDIGFLTCWDVAHGALWKAYAGKVDLMILCSSPPDALKASLLFNSIEIGPEKMGKTIRNMGDEGHNIFIRTVESKLLGLEFLQSALCLAVFLDLGYLKAEDLFWYMLFLHRDFSNT